MNEPEQILLAELDDIVTRTAEKLGMNPELIHDILYDYHVSYAGKRGAAAVCAGIYRVSESLVKQVVTISSSLDLDGWYPLIHSIQSRTEIDSVRFEEFRRYIRYRVRRFPPQTQDDIFSALLENLTTTTTEFRPWTTGMLLAKRLAGAVSRTLRVYKHEIPAPDAEAFALAAEGYNLQKKTAAAAIDAAENLAGGAE